MDSAALRVIIGNLIEKLSIPSGIPKTIEVLNEIIKQQFNITADFSLQYLDRDFEDFFTLSSTSQIKDKATIKVVIIEPVILNLYTIPQNERPDKSFTSEHDATCTSEPAQNYSDSSVPSSESPFRVSNIQEKKPWPAEFIIPQFSVETELVLQRANESYKKEGKLLTTTAIKSNILEKLAQSIYTYTAYPSARQVLHVAEALIKAHPCLMDRGSSSGLGGWQTSIKYKMANYRTKLRGFGIPDVACNARKHKNPDDKKPAKNIKKAKRAEVNYLPPYPPAEDEHSLDKVREELLTELKKKNNEKALREKMNQTFALRRHEVINQCPSVQTLKDRWPVLFHPSQVNAEFERITMVPLEPKFLSALDLHTPKLLALFRAKGGSVGQRLKNIMEMLQDSVIPSVERSREVVLRCLMEYLGEHSEHLIKECNDTDDLDLQHLEVAIIVITGAGASTCDGRKDIGIIIEGVKVITQLPSIPKACTILLGLSYALNLQYPKKLKYTFEVFQKLFLELDASKLSAKIQTLKNKLMT